MGSNPPKKDFELLSKSPPSGLACLDLSAIQETMPSSSATPHSLLSGVTPLSDDNLALSSRRISTESNTSTRWHFMPDALSFNRPGFFSNHPRVSIPRAVTSEQLSNSSKSSLSASSSFWPQYEAGKKEKKKKPKEKIRNQSIGFGFERDYPKGYKGFLEKYSKENGFSSKTRHILGINTFADSASTSLFSQELMNLDLNAKVFVSKAGKMRISESIGAYAKKKLLDSLCLYDRNMSFWLQESEAYEQYTKQMRAIFFDGENHLDMHTIFEAIPAYRDLEGSIQAAINPKDYHRIHKNLHVSFEEYRRVFYKKHKIDALEDVLGHSREDLENKEKILIEHDSEVDHSDILREMRKTEQKMLRMDAKIKKKKSSLERKQLDSVKSFSMEVRLSESFLTELSELQQKESGKVPDAIMNDLPKELPELDLGISREYILEVSLYFFAILCRMNQKFYGVIPIKSEEVLYINKMFARELEVIEENGNVEDFTCFMRSKKNDYDMGLMKIVADKALEYICENAQIRIDCSTIINDAFAAARGHFPHFGAEPYYCYGRTFFKILSDYVFAKIADSLIQSAEHNLDATLRISGLAPKP